MSKISKILVKCPRCDHEWKTKSKLIYIVCSSCLYKFKRIPSKETKTKILVKCPYCDHRWKTGSNATIITCSYCTRKFNKEKHIHVAE